MLHNLADNFRELLRKKIQMAFSKRIKSKKGQFFQNIRGVFGTT